jgi:GntR family transcriptional repressor for pyruvate dehydrogenase complex
MTESNGFRPLRRRRVHEDVAEQLRDAILDGRFKPGDKLPPERELAGEFGINRTSLREAIKLLEGLGLVTVRQGDGATVRPLIDASLEIIAPMIFHSGRIDAEMLADMTEVITPLLLAMARLAIERHNPADIAAVRHLRDLIADETRQREERFASWRDLLVLLSDMTHNRVWQMLARRLRLLLASAPLQETRRRLRRDPGRAVTVIDACLAALEAGRREDAVTELHRFFSFVTDNSFTGEIPGQVIAQETHQPTQNQEEAPR